MSLPKVLVMASQKGGVGKTCLSASLAVAAEQAGAGPVALIDLDPQQSLAEWWNRREAAFPQLVRLNGIPDLAGAIERCGERGSKLVVIDTPPSNTDTLRLVIEHADFVLIPSQDGLSDLNAIRHTVAMVREVQRPYAMALTFVNKRTTQYADAIKRLSRAGAIAAVISYRIIFKKADIDGRTVLEVEPGGPAAAEIAELWKFVGEEMGIIAKSKGEKALV
jgi:chromosome partitioning protein